MSAGMKTKKSPPPPPSIEECLFGRNDEISLSDLRKLASLGICDDQGSHRPLAWRILLGYLPCHSRREWPLVLEQKRSLYRELTAQVFCSPIEDGQQLQGHHGKQAAIHKLQLETEAIRQQAEEDIDNVVMGIKQVGILNTNTTTTTATTTIVDGVKSQPQENGGDAHDDAETQEDAEKEGAKNEEETQETPSVESQVDDAAATPDERDDEDKEKDAHAAAEAETSLTSPTIATTTTTTLMVPPPAHVCDEWKKRGRDASVLVEMSHGGHYSHGINTLLVVGAQDKQQQQDDDNDEQQWSLFLDHASLLDEIRKDVVRTHPDLKFFLEPTDNLGRRRYAAMERILFVWAKLNKGVRYVQGMNEIVGTLYFVLANDFHHEWARHAEADTYFLFNTLMAEMSDIFVPAMDNHDTGIQGRIGNMNALLSLHDPEVALHLEEVGIHASFYAIRWLTTLLSREFLLPDTIRLWDSMFASTHKDNFLRYVCVTMVMVIRDDLLKGDFSSCLRLLQSYPPPTNLDSLLESSRALWIYESQITLACHKGGISLSQALCTIHPPPSVVMAYGLVGGVATIRRRRTTVMMRGGTEHGGGSGGEQQQGNDEHATATTSALQGRAFLTGAKDYLSGLGREAAKTYQSRRGAGSGGSGGGAGTTNEATAAAAAARGSLGDG